MSFTLQMSMLIIVGYVVSVFKPVEILIQKVATIPNSGCSVILLITTFSFFY